MKVLLLGSGGREHTFAWKISQSPLLKKLWIAPGNAGTAQCGENVPLNPLNFEEIKTFVIHQSVDMLIVGPEDPLVQGIYDFFAQDDILKNVVVIGPSALGAQLEGSKNFAKDFMVKYNIPTAAYKTFQPETIDEACHFIDSLKAPYVLKADGLAAGKGVVILNNGDEAKEELKQMLLGKKFGQASQQVVIEEFLSGIELSVFVLTDGNSFLLLPEAKDYKRIGEGDTGLNTGGMGTISGIPFADKIFMEKVVQQIIQPTMEGLKNEKIIYKGFIFFGLMNVDGNPYVIEYNVRMGDPETESVLPRIKNDLLEIFSLLSEGKLNEVSINMDDRKTATVMMVSGGYPEAYTKGKVISGLNEIKDSLVFHAGTTIDTNGNLITNGGRVVAVTSFGTTIQEALQTSYANAEKIEFEGKYFRKDLGFDII
jgi:phosphoribosylamine--glycine ligase